MIKLVFTALCVTVFCSGINAQDIDEQGVKKDIGFLASDKLKGRGTATKGEKKAAAYIATRFKECGLVALGTSYLKPFSYKKSNNPCDTSTAKVKEKTSQNVVGYLDNKAPYTIVIGGHYDHLGLGHDFNSREANPEGKIHNGADDNASGTAGVIELARYFSLNKQTEPYNFLFICFSGEELGLLGSKKWCENPDIELGKINYMVNMDMIGRLNDSTKKLVVYGVGTSSSFVPLIDSVSTQLNIQKDSSGIGPSDQTSFYLKDIPALHFFTGQHKDYHKPSDDADKINYSGETEVLRYIIKVIEKTYHYPKLAFFKTRNRDTQRVVFKVTMGVMPDYTFSGSGMRIDDVVDNRPAFKAGIVKGDVVRKIGTSEVKDVYSYMKALSNFKKGETTTIEVLRGENIKVMDITF